MNRRVFLSGSLAAALEAAPARKKNVVLIVSDDLNNGLGCLGNAVAKTPNLDAFAKRSVLFDYAYCQFPLCAPSRASFLSGRRPDKTKVWTLHTPTRQYMQDVVMLPELFKRNGWYSAGIGKIFHNGPEHDDPRSWDLMETGQSHLGTPKVMAEHQMPKPRNHTMSWAKLEVADEKTGDGATARRAAGLIRGFARDEKPFFLGVGFHAPHSAYNAPVKYFDLYDPAKIPAPKVPEGYARTIPEAAWYELAEQRPPSEQETREYRAAYYACVSFMDAQVGVVLDALRQNRLWDNTVVVFLSDNGYHTGEHGMWHKMTLFEESTRLPLIIHAPGVKGAGTPCHGLVEFIDIYPTLAELCGIKPPAGLDGESLAPALNDPVHGGKSAVYSSVGRHPDRKRLTSDLTYLGQSVRTEDWRYTEWDEGRKGVELYDEHADPAEMRNLGDSPQFAAVRAQLKKLLHEHSFTVK
jgi:iduronate 2-sulfatase